MANFYGELIVRFVADTSGLKKGFAEAQTATAAGTKKLGTNMGKVGLAMQNVGRTMSQFVTLPVVAGLGYATYAAYKYEKAMIQVKNLTGLNAAEAAKYSESVREMAANIGIAPQAAAEAFYFIASSGFTAKESVDALNISMKASVAGMGDIQTTADVITSAVNAYGHSNLTAAHAMDVLMRTIEVGKAEPEALAHSLGRIMPVANSLGVNIEDLGGMIASLTLTGLSSAEAVTSLRGTMMALVAPAKMSIDRLKEMGLSYKEVTRSIKEEGLLPTLQMLWEKTDGNKLAMRQIIPNIRALNGVLSLLGPNYQKNLDVIAKVNDAQGKLNETYEYASQTPIAKFNRAMASIKSSFIEIGQIILPKVASMLESVASLMESFGDAPGWLQKLTIGFAVLLAVIGPVAMVLGSITRGIALLGIKTAAQATAAQVAAIANAELAASNAAVGASATAAAAETQALTTAISVSRMGALGALGAAGLVGAIGGLAIAEAITKEPLTYDQWVEFLNVPEVSVPVTYVPGNTEKVKEKIRNLRLDGEVVLTSHDKRVWEQLHGIAAYIKDGKNWRLVIDAQSALQTFLESLGKDGVPIPAHLQMSDLTSQFDELGKPLAAHKQTTALEVEAKVIWNEMTIKNPFEKRVPFKVPVEFEAWSAERRNAYYKTLLPSEALQVKWELQQVGEFKLPTVDETATIGIGQRIVFNYIAGMESARDDASTKAGQIATGVTTKLNAASFGTYGYGSNAAWGFANGVGDDAAYAAAVAHANALADGVEAALDRGESPWPSTAAMGTDFVAGFTKGITDGTKDAVSKVMDLANQAIALGASAFRTGASIADNVASGIRSGSSRAVSAATQMGRAVLAAQADMLGMSLAVQPVYAGASMGVEPRRFAPGLEYGLAAVAMTPRQAESAGDDRRAPREIHYHNHMNLPQGLVVSDVERFGRTVQPFVERGTLLAQRRRQRGRPGL